jgi:hypothetical protein
VDVDRRALALCRAGPGVLHSLRGQHGDAARRRGTGLLLQVWVTHSTVSSHIAGAGDRYYSRAEGRRAERWEGSCQGGITEQRAYAGSVVLKTKQTTRDGTAATVPAHRVGLNTTTKTQLGSNPTHRTVDHILHIALDVGHDKLVHIRLLAERMAQADDGIEDAHERGRRGLGGERRGVRGDAPAAPGVAGDDDWAWGQECSRREAKGRSGAEQEGGRSGSTKSMRE